MATGASSPRSARRRIFGVLLLLAGLGFLTALVFKEGRLVVLGKRATATVVSVEERHSLEETERRHNFGTSRSYEKKGGGVSYWMTCNFTTADGQPATFKTVATFRTEAKAGDEHPIIYLPSNPSVATIDTVKQIWLPFAVGLTVTTACLGGSYLLLRRRSETCEAATAN